MYDTAAAKVESFQIKQFWKISPTLIKEIKRANRIYLQIFCLVFRSAILAESIFMQDYLSLVFALFDILCLIWLWKISKTNQLTKYSQNDPESIYSHPCNLESTCFVCLRENTSDVVHCFECDGCFANFHKHSDFFGCISQQN